MNQQPRVVIGTPIYNREKYLPQALDSLLSQSYTNFQLVIVDDCSSDRSRDIAEAYARMDTRVVYVRNKKRLGMIGNWRCAFERARQLCADAPYFAWGSDHDVWHRQWLAELVAVLESHPSTALALPVSLRISDTGEILRGGEIVELVGGSSISRLGRVIRTMSAGNMVYGLYRAAMLEQAGVFRSVLLPDRLLLSELSLYGDFRQVPRVLWYRRWFRTFSYTRQRTSFFPNGSPIYSYLPWWLTHAGILAWNLGLHGRGRPTINRARGLAIAAAYLWLSIARDAERHYLTGAKSVRKRWVRPRKQGSKRRKPVASRKELLIIPKTLSSKLDDVG